MNKTYSLVRPDAQEWSALPLRPAAWRQMVVACLIGVATTSAAFIADRGWEDLPPEYWDGTYQVLDMFGISAIFMAILFSVGGWFFGRLAVAMAPLVLLYAAVPFTVDGNPSALIWWAGTIAATLWWFFQANFTVRQIRAVHTLAKASGTRQTVELGPIAGKALKRVTRRGICWAAGLSLVAALFWVATLVIAPTELGHTHKELGDLALSDYLTTAAAGMSILALIQWLRCGWRGMARRHVGNSVWHVPVGNGPVQGLWSQHSRDLGTVPFGEAQSLPTCICIEEYLRSDPDEDEDFYETFGVSASNYCPVHGLDQINSLAPEEFRSNATNTWLWDEDSPEPSSAPAEANRSLLIGYAGHAFTGLPARFENGWVECDPYLDYLAPEREPGFEEPHWERPLPPPSGVLDRIDLVPAGLGGYAIRYRHGRAWFEANDRALGSPLIASK
ncbi:hypothetical protein [Paeniglutamicibacter sp. NPDC091659]|uniref:hypothetical protein n=1 Tax=Paeniglutamicibacter sp. NPDC091659 TaxID=3364389 RepID=UPI0038267066